MATLRKLPKVQFDFGAIRTLPAELAELAPDIIEAWVAGEDSVPEPECLIRRGFPADCGAQRELFGLPWSAATTDFLAALLNRRAWHAAVGAVHAAVARFRLQHRVALLAFIEPLAGVRRHSLGLAVPTFRASQCRLQDDRAHFPPTVNVDG